jgi:hypothetical protein
MADPEIVQVIVQPQADVVIGATVSGSESSTVAYHHVQGASNAVWEIQHGLGFFPNVTTMDSGGSTVEGELAHISKYSLRVTFSAPISGDAYLS